MIEACATGVEHVRKRERLNCGKCIPRAKPLLRETVCAILTQSYQKGFLNHIGFLDSCHGSVESLLLEEGMFLKPCDKDS